MKCVGIIWNCSFEFTDDILKLISQYAKITNRYHIDLKANYTNFVRAIYSTDSIATWKVDKKIEYMSKYSSTSVCIVYFEIDTSILRYHDKKKHFVYSNLQDMKDIIRETYKDKLPYYFFDIVFHCSETEEEYNSDIQILEQFT